eukprot:4701626-Pleurochrysis_carterae.AAC.2
MRSWGSRKGEYAREHAREHAHTHTNVCADSGACARTRVHAHSQPRPRASARVGGLKRVLSKAEASEIGRRTRLDVCHLKVDHSTGM